VLWVLPYANIYIEYKIAETKRRNKEAKLLALQIENGVSEFVPDTP